MSTSNATRVQRECDSDGRDAIMMAASVTETAGRIRIEEGLAAVASLAALARLDWQTLRASALDRLKEWPVRMERPSRGAWRP